MEMDINENILIGSRIMNEDVVEEILRYINCRQLFRITRVSRQFSFCVDRLLRRRKVLGLGESDKTIDCFERYHKNDRFLDKELEEKDFISIASHCPNIRCLYLNQRLNPETIAILSRLCPRVECLCIGSISMNALSDHLETIGNEFGERLLHLSAEMYFIQEDIKAKVIQLIPNLKSLENLKINHFKPLEDSLTHIESNLRSLHINCSPFWFSDFLGDTDIKGLVAFVTKNGQRLKRLIISDYNITEESLSAICRNSDLNRLSIGCRHLSFDSLIRIIAKSQTNLEFLELNGVVDEELRGDWDRFPMNVKHLRLNWCHFRVKAFLQFIQMFRFLEIFEFNGLYFRCDCENGSESEMFFCAQSDRKVITQLFRMQTFKDNLKVLVIEDVMSSIAFIWQSLPSLKNLSTLKVPNICRSNLQKLIPVLLAIARSRPEHCLTVVLKDNSNVKSMFIEELNARCDEKPRNLRIV